MRPVWAIGILAAVAVAGLSAFALLSGSTRGQTARAHDAASSAVTIPAPVPPPPPWESENPVVPLPKVPVGLDRTFEELAEPPMPERARLGRWLFFDKRLSGDGTVSCATCHRPAHAFSEPTAVSTGVGGKLGLRKAPPVLNLAWTIYPHFFWDGRANSLEAQALGPVANPIEMGNTHAGMVQTLGKVQGYAPYFGRAFGDPAGTADRIAKALADYERTRLSGNAPFDRWQAGDATAVNASVKRGFDLFMFGKAACNQCHLGSNFTDTNFHNLGVGWDEGKRAFKDDGRYAVTKKDEDRGAFRTPTLRELARRAPYMHDGSQATLRDVVEFYNRGGTANPYLDAKMKPLGLAENEVDALVAFLQSLAGEGFMDEGPKAFPQ